MFYHHTDIQMLIFKDPSSNCVDPKMKVKTETQQTFIYFTNSNCLRISSLWMLFLPYPPDPWPSSPLLWSIFFSHYNTSKWKWNDHLNLVIVFTEHFNKPSIFNRCSTSILPENIRKLEVFWCFQGV